MLRPVVHLLVDGRRRLRAGGGLLAIALMAAGCDVTPEKIERWKVTEKGPSKLREALRNSSLPVDIRAQALTALVEVGEVSEVAEDLKEVAEAQRRDVVHAAVKPLVAMARGSGTQAPGETKRRERQGKDALFFVRDGASPEDRKVIDEALIEWTTVDLDGRMTAGAASSERILAAIGAPVGPRLVALLADPKTSDTNRTSAAALLGKLGDREGREAGGAKLVERARAERKPSELTLSQMGLVGGDRVVAYLAALASDAQKPGEVRANALLTLAKAPDPAELGTAIRLAGDPRAPPAVRDAAFEVLSKLGPAAVPALARLLDDKNEKIRWEAAETMLLAGRTAAIAPVLDGLPAGRSYPKEDLADFLVRDLVRLGAPALEPLREELKSQSWVARLAAAMAIAQLGKPDDAPRLEALSADTTRLKGWPGSATVGGEMKALAAALRGKQ